MRRRIGNIFANSTTRKSHPADCFGTPLPPLNPQSHTHTGASLRHMRGANVKCIKKRQHDDGMWNSPRRAATANLPPASPPPHPPLLASLPRVWLPRAVTRKTTQFSACMPPVEAACDPLHLRAGSIRRRVKGRRGDGGGDGPQFDGAESCERASSKKNRTKSHLTGVVSGHQHHANISHVANCRARVAARVCQWASSGGTLVCAMHFQVEMR